jgi:signal peptidase I
MDGNVKVGGEQMAKKKKNEWLEWTKALLLALGLAFFIRIFLFAPIIVDGPSMLPTLHDRDQMIVNKASYYFNDPERFDIVVFHASSQKDFIKRVIGVPGEHVAVIDNVLHINGEPVEEDFLMDEAYSDSVRNDFSLEELPGQHEVIPEGEYLVLGDNRSNSTDSRMIGLISEDEIVGKASLIYWPLSRIQFVGD